MNRTAVAVRLVTFLLLTVPTMGMPNVASLAAQAPSAQAAGRAERTTWFIYKVKWGHQDEFVDLFQKNHYPVLREQVKSGRMTSVRTFVPTNHGDGRADWTFAVAITFKDAAAMMGPSGEDEIVRRLYPNRAQFLKEEQRRFEILDAHWDVPLNEVDMETRRPSGN
jgi:hypothetical protein